MNDNKDYDNTYFFELTDTFGSELNYSHVTRFMVIAKSITHAVKKVSQETGYKFRFNGSYYKARSACIGLVEIGQCCSIEENINQYKDLNTL